MSSKEILFHNEALAQIATGLNALVDSVKVTLGPRRRNVILDRAYGPSLISKDGVTVAKRLSSKATAPIGARNW